LATIYGHVVGIDLFDSHRGPRHVARVRLKVDSDYTASSDTLQIGGGGSLFGTASSLDLEDMIESCRKDGKTVNLIDGMAGGAGGGASNVARYIDTVAVSGNNLTAEVADSASTEQNLAEADNVNAMEVWVCYDLS
jgi:hypothetical protein